MKLILKENNHYIIRFDFGEEFAAEFKKFCETEKIEAGFFTGLGAASVVDLQTFNLETKQYSRQSFKEQLEVANLNGNISKKDGEIIIHTHGTLGRENFETLSGHVSKLIVSATLEIHLTTLGSLISRELDDLTSLNLLS